MEQKGKMKTPVAFLGLGIMGASMAGNLINKGFDVTVFNRSPEKASDLKARGAKVANTPSDAVKGAAFVISMLSDDNAARGVWLGADGALSRVSPGTILIESSTISPTWADELSQAAKSKGCELLDAPVTGSRPAAAAGELVFLVGGSATTLEKARPVLAAMSRDIIHLGPSGSGAMVKLINNFVCGVQAVAIGEALALIEKTGLNPVKAMAILTEGVPGSPMTKMAAKRMMASDFTPNFLLPLMTKDLRYASEEARKHSMALTTAAAAIGVMQKALDAGLGDKDFSSVIQVIRK